MGVLLIAGCGGHASVVAEAARLQGCFAAIHCVETGGSSFEEQAHQFARFAANYPVFSAIVGIGDNFRRGCLMQAIEALIPSIEWAVVRHPQSVVSSSACIGPGSFVAAMAIVGVGSTVGRGCILNHHSCLDHEGHMGNYSSLAPRATVGGNTHIGAYTAVGLGACLIHGLRVGAHTVIGAGAVVLHDVPEGVVAYGCPARVVRQRKANEPYL